MKPMTQGSLAKSFKAIRLARGHIFYGRRRGSPSVVDAQKSINHGLRHKETFQEVSRQSDLQAAKSSVDDDVDRCRSATLKNQSPMAYDTRKPPKKFQDNLTCAGPNLRWTTTWIAVVYDTRKPPKKFRSNPTCARPNLRWMTMWIAVAYDTRKPPKKFQGNRTCARPNLRLTTTWITVGRKPPMKFEGDPSRSPGGRPRGSPVHQISMSRGSTFFYAKSHVHMLGHNEAYDTRKPPNKFQGNPTIARPNLRWTTSRIAVGSLPRSLKAIRVGRPAVDHVDRRPSKITE
ncbi:uncharacterized protein G2W53_026908 [Senna tora]|uniref:Uncharacterized protein n=1 Tax=Senna tora TaxID=362788 RepID=A0A834TG45_9FABA|nr:uncharacterized protein G2W53_026908 [Senna tora]